MENNNHENQCAENKNSNDCNIIIHSANENIPDSDRSTTIHLKLENMPNIKHKKKAYNYYEKKYAMINENNLLRREFEMIKKQFKLTSNSINDNNNFNITIKSKLKSIKANIRNFHNEFKKKLEKIETKVNLPWIHRFGKLFCCCFYKKKHNNAFENE